MGFAKKTINGEEQETEIVKLKGRLDGTINLEKFFPYAINSIKIKSGDYEVEVARKIENNKIRINETKPYDCWILNDVLNFAERVLEPGNYSILCNVTNKLRTSNGQENVSKEFSVENLSISNGTDAETEYAAFLGPELSILYYHNDLDYSVPGNIILENEYLHFSDREFKVYNLSNGGILDTTNYSIYISHINGETKIPSFPNKFDYTTLVRELGVSASATTKFNFNLIFNDGEETLKNIHT
jgi:hypothetical protein